MRIALWLSAYAAALGVQIAVLPAWGWVAIPLAHLVFLSAIAFERPTRALGIAAVAGIMRDSIALTGGASHTIVFLVLAAIVSGLHRLTDWDEPLRTITALAIGLAATPLGALVSFGITPSISGEAITSGPWYAFPVAPEPVAFIGAGMWIGVIAFLMIRGFFRRTSDSFIGR